MIRERVNIHGHVRVMEAVEKIEALNIPVCQIGIIKEAPLRRWLEGQEMWDTNYKRAAKRVIRSRRKVEVKAEKTSL